MMKMERERLLVIYRSGGFGDFVKTWGFLRGKPAAVVVTKEDHGELLRNTLRHEVLPYDPWKSLFTLDGCPPPLVVHFREVVVYRHEVFAHQDELIESGLKAMNPNVRAEFRSFCPAHCEGKEPTRARNEFGRVVFHVGAGLLKFSKERTAIYLKRRVFPIKAWELSHSLKFASIMERRGYPVHLVAGPEQRRQWDHQTLAAFQARGLLQEDGLLGLKGVISRAKCFVGFDSGPTHLAAQLGIPTVGIYGPTGANGIDRNFHDLLHAEPLGAAGHVRLIQPDGKVPDSAKPWIRWLKPERAADRVQRFLCEVYGAKA